VTATFCFQPSGVSALSNCNFVLCMNTDYTVYTTLYKRLR
jgi:hypothetical protein